MPLIQINLAEGRRDEEKRALLAAVTEAAHTSIGVPTAAIRVWIHEFRETEYMAAGELLADKRSASS